MKKTDIDIDVKDRDNVLASFKHIRALSKKDVIHNVGVYIQDIPYDPLNNAASIDFREADEIGFFKIDVLYNSVYDNVKSEAHLDSLINQEPDWKMLLDEEVVLRLAQIRDYSKFIKVMKPRTVEELAMAIALIRPAKKHLIGRSWADLKFEIWEKPTGDEYYFKKAHAIAFALSIVVQLNLIREELVE